MMYSHAVITCPVSIFVNLVTFIAQNPEACSTGQLSSDNQVTALGYLITKSATKLVVIGGVGALDHRKSLSERVVSVAAGIIGGFMFSLQTANLLPSISVEGIKEGLMEGSVYVALERTLEQG